MIDGVPTTYSDALPATTEKEARKQVDRLVNAGFKVGKVTSVDSDKPQNLVLNYFPKRAHDGDAHGAASAGPSCERIFASPRRMRPLTVPTGVSSIEAISDWLKPPK